MPIAATEEGIHDTETEYTTVYIAGPMRGRPHYNFPAFDAAAYTLRDEGYDVISPADLDREIGFDGFEIPYDADTTEAPEGFDLIAAFRRDLNAVLKCDAVAVLPGWQGSKGATAEVHVAAALGKTIFCAETFETIEIHSPKRIEPQSTGVDESPLVEAARVVSGARQHAYGHPLDNHGNTAELWRAWLKRRFGVDIAIEAEDVCWLMVLLKASREANRPKHDNLVDGCGYLQNVHMIRTERARRESEDPGSDMADRPGARAGCMG